MNVIIFSTKAYENKSNWTLGQNKPNQTQFQDILLEMRLMTMKDRTRRTFMKEKS